MHYIGNKLMSKTQTSRHIKLNGLLYALQETEKDTK